MKLIETGLCLLLTDVENVELSLSIRISKKGTGNVDVQKPESVVQEVEEKEGRE
jgi:hypothetical protein